LEYITVAHEGKIAKSLKCYLTMMMTITDAEAKAITINARRVNSKK
jgi:hypothetical protein